MHLTELRTGLMDCRAKWGDSKTDFVNLGFEDNLKEFGLVVEPNTLKSVGE